MALPTKGSLRHLSNEQLITMLSNPKTLETPLLQLLKRWQPVKQLPLTFTFVKRRKV